MRGRDGKTLGLSDGTTPSKGYQSELRPRWSRFAGALVVGIAGVSPAGPAFAQSSGASAPPTVPLPVQVTVAASFCASAADVEAEVTRRSPQLRFVPSSAARQATIDGQARDASGQVGAVLVLRTEMGLVQNRELWAKSCDDLVKAVGFVVSVTYDPPEPQPLEAAPEPSPEPQATSAPPPAPKPTPVAAERRRLRSDADPSPSGPRAADQEPATWRGGLGGNAVWGVAPGPMWGGGAALAVSWGPRFGVGGVARLAASGQVGGPDTFTGGVATFRRWSAELAVGPEWHLGVAHLAAVVTGRAGLLEAVGSSTIEAGSYDRPWFDAGGSILARIELGAGFQVEGELGLARPFTRYAFQFDPFVFHRVSTWLPSAGVLLSIAF